MTGELHEISMAIGRLEAQNQEALIQRREIWTQLNDINHKVSKIEHLEIRVTRMDGELGGLTDLRKKAAGAMIILAGIASMLGAVGAAAKTWLFGH